MLRTVLPASKRLEQVKPVQSSAVAQSIGFTPGDCPAWRPFPASFLGESDHRIRLEKVREESGRIGPLYEPHGDLRGEWVMVERRWPMWPAHKSEALSWPASLLVGAVFSDGVPF